MTFKFYFNAAKIVAMDNYLTKNLRTVLYDYFLKAYVYSYKFNLISDCVVNHIQNKMK